MIENLLTGCEPTLHNMALGTVWAELTQVNVSVAIGAVLSDVSESRARVTSRAFHLFMAAAEWIFGPIMIKFRNFANR